MKQNGKLSQRYGFYLSVIFLLACAAIILWVPTDGDMQDGKTFWLLIFWFIFLFKAHFSILRRLPIDGHISPVHLGMGTGMFFGTMPAIVAILDAPVVYGIVVHSAVFYAIVLAFVLDDLMKRLDSIVRRKFFANRSVLLC